MKAKTSLDFDPKSFLKALSSPWIFPFISKEKLVKSDQFRRIIDSFDEHFDRHRDAVSFERLLALLDGSQYANILADYLRLRHGLIISREQEGIKVSVPKKAVPPDVQREVHAFGTYFDGRKSSIGKKIPGANTSVRVGSRKKYIDALDHPARLPGSYGSGKR